MTTTEYYKRLTQLRKKLAAIKFYDSIHGETASKSRSQQLYDFSVEVDNLRTELEDPTS